MVVQGCFVPGMETTRHPGGNGTWQGRPISPFSIEKLHDNSVVAPKSSTSCALVSEGEASVIEGSKTKRQHAMRRIIIVDDGSTVLRLAAMETAA